MIRLLDAIQFAIERLWQFRILVLWALLGLIASTTLALSLPLYVDAVNSKLLASRLGDPPYAFRFRYLGSWQGNIGPDSAAATQAAILEGFTGTVGMPTVSKVDFARTVPMGTRLTPNGGKAVNLGAFSLAVLNGAESQMEIVAGQWPPANTASDGAISVLLPQKMLYSMGVTVGDTLTATPSGGKALTLHVAAMWRAKNSSDPSWIFPTKFFDEIVLLRPDDFQTVISGLKNPIEEAAWYLSFDGYDVKTADVGSIVTHVNNGQRDVEAVLPGIRLELSPVQRLQAFSDDVARLTQQLAVMVLPVGGLVLYFVSLVAGLLVTRQQAEDVTLRSRGMSRFAILRIHFLMWLILAAAALAIGVVIAPELVQLVGRATSFLQFSGDDPPLTIVFTPLALGVGAITALIAASSGMLLAWRTSRQTITSFRVHTARARQAWWQRFYLDFMLLLPSYYVLYSLSQRGGLTAGIDDPFSDPLVFLGPTLFALGNTLLFLRLWPMSMRFLAWVTAFGRGVPIMMALRELTRSISRYRGALLMMCFTLSLIGFTASIASTMDRSLKDTMDYRIGADAVIVSASDANTETSDDGSTTTVTGFNTLPVADLLTIPSVQAASRVGRYPAQMRLSNQTVQATVVGMDRATMAAIAKFRDDYSSMPLADLMNLLAGNRNGLLISTQMAVKYNLRINQTITYQVQALNQWYEIKAPILGMLDYFPTLDPRTKAFMLTTIEPIWEAVGTELPHDVWLSLDPAADRVAVQAAARELGFAILEWRDPQVALKVALASPSRRGVLGFLSIGFVASIALTLISSVVQNAASFRAQAVQLGSLRAMGLSSLSLGAYLIISQGTAVLSGILGGTGIGVATTLLYLPLLDFSDGLPPYLVRVAWDNIFIVYGLFAGVLFALTLLTTFILGRQQLFTMVKLGDAA